MQTSESAGTFWRYAPGARVLNQDEMILPVQGMRVKNEVSHSGKGESAEIPYGNQAKKEPSREARASP